MFYILDVQGKQYHSTLKRSYHSLQELMLQMEIMFCQGLFKVSTLAEYTNIHMLLATSKMSEKMGAYWIAVVAQLLSIFILQNKDLKYIQ